MATDAHGWVEVYDPDDRCWDAVVVATQFMERDYALFDTWFAGRSTAATTAFAARGLPDDISPHVAAEVKEWGSVERPTWVRWDECQFQPLLDVAALPGWNVLFALMATLSDAYQPQPVRLVIWFDQ
ncbi:hypothetical protein [Deinococcus alpinitundrae]|uniref:hypothetical protein n=1 Tax=Deinococcus alpinitundrae TaxID=468913 RepID=UPI00137B54CD|nr:hypothetical protein [Deinococcus alpinitundrae]